MTSSKENSRVGYIIPFIIEKEINTILYLCNFISFFVLCSVFYKALLLFVEVLQSTKTSSKFQWTINSEMLILQSANILVDINWMFHSVTILSNQIFNEVYQDL